MRLRINKKTSIAKLGATKSKGDSGFERSASTESSTTAGSCVLASRSSEAETSTAGEPVAGCALPPELPDLPSLEVAKKSGDSGTDMVVEPGTGDTPTCDSGMDWDWAAEPGAPTCDSRMDWVAEPGTPTCDSRMDWVAEPVTTRSDVIVDVLSDLQDEQLLQGPMCVDLVGSPTPCKVSGPRKDELEANASDFMEVSPKNATAAFENKTSNESPKPAFVATAPRSPGAKLRVELYVHKVYACCVLPRDSYL